MIEDVHEDIAARVDRLEMRIAYQDDTIEDLNATITAQWTLIDALKREMDRLADRLAQAERAAALAGPPEPPPPHY